MHGGDGIGQIWFGLDPLWVSTVILVATYIGIMVERLNRAIVALLASGILILVGLFDQAEALKGVDWNTIALLTGMMILVAVTRKCGVFQYVAIVAAQVVKARPAGLIVMLSIVTAVFSAFLDNVTTVLLVAPVTLMIARELEIPPYPLLFAEIFASNIGGTATLIGDPPNILIGSLVGLSFNDFVVHLAPVIVVVLAVQILMIHLLWGRQMKATFGRRDAGHGHAGQRLHHRLAADEASFGGIGDGRSCLCPGARDSARSRHHRHARRRRALDAR